MAGLTDEQTQEAMRQAGIDPATMTATGSTATTGIAPDATKKLTEDEAIGFIVNEKLPGGVKEKDARRFAKLWLATMGGGKEYTQAELVAADLRPFLAKVLEAADTTAQVGPIKTKISHHDRQRQVWEELWNNQSPGYKHNFTWMEDATDAASQIRDAGGIDLTSVIGANTPSTVDAKLGPMDPNAWTPGAGGVPQPGVSNQLDYSLLTTESASGVQLTQTGDPLSTLMSIERVRKQNMLPPLQVMYSMDPQTKLTAPTGFYIPGSATDAQAQAALGRLKQTTTTGTTKTINEFLTEPQRMSLADRTEMLGLLARAGFVNRQHFADGEVLPRADDPEFLDGWRRWLLAYVQQSGDLEGNKNPNAVSAMDLLRQRAAEFDALGTNDFAKLKGSTGPAALDISLTDPASIRAQTATESQSTFGRLPTSAELQQMVGTVHMAERTQGQQANAARMAQGSQQEVPSVDVEARIREAVRASNPAEAEAHDLASQFAMFQQMILGSGIGR